MNILKQKPKKIGISDKINELNKEKYVIEKLTFIDFFSGIGGFRKGLELCGMTCKGHCEIDKFADKSYRAIFDIKEDEWYAEDITKVKGEELPRVNIWTAGFPCQDISVSGKQRGLAGERSSLFFEIIRLLKGKTAEDRPEWLIFENVKNLFSVNKGWDFATILTLLAEVGYHIEYGLLNSKFHSVPQNRERVYIVAYRHFRADSERKVFPVRATDAKALIQLIGGKQGKRVYDSKGISCTLTAVGGGFACKTGMYFIDLCKGKPKLTENARCIKARYDSGISNLSADKSGVLCLSADYVSNESKDNIYRYGRIRKLTPRECWRLQGFSDEMFDRAAAVNSDSQLYKQAGNGVTIPVVYAIGIRISMIENVLNN